MFVNAEMLAGLGGAALPLVLHLLSRWRYRTVEWGAMMFLGGADPAPQRAARLKQAILLAMRMAIIGLLAMALARPVLRSAWGMLSEGGPITAVVVLDRSYSMSHDEEGRARFELAREAALGVLSSLRPGDKAALVLTGESDRAPETGPTADLQRLARRITEMDTPRGAPADMASALSQAADLVWASDTAASEVYLITDRQALNWRDANDALAAAFKARVARMPTRLVVVPVGGGQADNLAIESVSVLNPPVIRDAPCEVEVQLRSYGATRRQAAVSLLTLRAGGEETRRVRRSVWVEAHGTTTLRASIAFRDPRAGVLSVRLEDAGLAADDRYDLAVEVIDRLRVLVISGDEREPGDLRSESALLRLALAPLPRSGNPAEVVVRRPEDWPGLSLRGFGVVVLANVWQVSAAQARALEQFVYEGGGLIIAPGNLCRVDNYNALLWRNGAGVMPMRLGPPTGTEGVGGSGSASGGAIAWIDREHPIFRFCGGEDPAPSGAVLRHFTTEAISPLGRVLARFATGQPYMAEGSLGRGRTLLITTPLDLDWSNLAQTTFFLPMAQSAVRHLAAAPPMRNVRVGEELVLEDDEPIDERRVVVRTPDDRPMDRAALQVMSLGQRWQARYSATQRPGWYRITGAGDDAVFVVHAGREESDTTPLSVEQWEELRNRLGFDTIDPRQESVASAVVRSRGGRELWLVLLTGAIVLAIGELWLAGRWTS